MTDSAHLAPGTQPGPVPDETERALDGPGTTPDGAVPAPGACCGSDLSRRDVLAGLGVLGATVALAACGPSTPEQVTVEGGPAGAVARVDDVPVGGAVSARLDETNLIVAQPEAGVFVAHSARCPHEGCRVAPDGGELRCPCHGSTFELDGTLVRGPATTGLTPVTVRVDGEFLVAELA